MHARVGAGSRFHEAQQGCGHTSIVTGIGARGIAVFGRDLYRALNRRRPLRRTSFATYSWLCGVDSGPGEWPEGWFSSSHTSRRSPIKIRAACVLHPGAWAHGTCLSATRACVRKLKKSVVACAY